MNWLMNEPPSQVVAMAIPTGEPSANPSRAIVPKIAEPMKFMTAWALMAASSPTRAAKRSIRRPLTTSQTNTTNSQVAAVAKGRMLSEIAA
jgi:hypothetical protein